jgi:hypothetical protein
LQPESPLSQWRLSPAKGRARLRRKRDGTPTYPRAGGLRVLRGSKSHLCFASCDYVIQAKPRTP